MSPLLTPEQLRWIADTCDALNNIDGVNQNSGLAFGVAAAPLKGGAVPHLSDLFSLDLFEQRVANGYVRTVKHPVEALWIANYSPKTQYERAWDEVTRACRGLIYDDTGSVVARPFPKFHNWDEGGAEIPSGPMIVSPKMDGSLGILYHRPGLGWAIASRGSFSSEQALAGTELLRRDWPQGWEPNPDYTYLFEILFPENRIVVDYGDFSGLVLLDVISKATGEKLLGAHDLAPWPHKVEHKVYPAFTDSLVHEIEDTEEGFVLYFPHKDYRLKMKGSRYVHLHRIITNTSSVTVWEYLAQNKPFEALLENVPDEFYDWVQQTRHELVADYTTVYALATEHYNQIRHLGMDRKAFAAEAKKRPYTALLFRLLDGKSVVEEIWKIVKPDRTLPFWGTEAVNESVA